MKRLFCPSAAPAGLLTAAALTAVFFSMGAHAGEWDTESDIRVGPGMKVIKAGDANVIVPEDESAYEDEQGRIQRASPEEYAVQEFSESENRINGIEAEVAELKIRVKELEDKLEDAVRNLRELEKDMPKNEP